MSRQNRVIFTRKMRRDYKILMPMMLPIHFTLLQRVLKRAGYDLVLLENDGNRVVETGLRFVHNDTCYPALLVVGQMLDALQNGGYDPDKTALLMSQTGGGCRASNYIHLIRKAIAKAGFAKVPVISANLSGMEKNPGFSITLRVLRKAIAALVYGDMLMLLANQTRPYEVVAGTADLLVQSWQNRLIKQFDSGKGLGGKPLAANLEAIASDFDAVEIVMAPKVKVGIVGEIYVKYSKLANNDLEGFLASQDCEVMVPGVLSFMIFSVDHRIEDHSLYGGNPFKRLLAVWLKKMFLKLEANMLTVLRRYPHFTAPSPFSHLKELAEGIIGYGNKMGEGWLLTAEMLELISLGYGNIVCAQPFGCLPNHISGKGMIHKLHAMHPNSNIVAIDYDPSATRVNQENRIKLMLAVGREALDCAPVSGGAAAQAQAARA
ncbi:MAG: 2-hydroxyacyl-CoA dehydratase [Pygmaiobacter sp.]|nr:2-hydroxyacyl-CoA dehydratase [Pygmaiobacter sp.]